MTEATVGREPIQIVEILQPLCENEFGVSPCTATGTADTKCYNTRATCQDTANFALGTPLSLFFAKGMVAEAGVSGADYIIPSLVSVSTSPTRINLASANPDAQGLGNRALCSITFQDHAHSDRVVDPYVDGRSWNPLDKSRGSFWTRWLVRNKYRQNIQIRVYEGYAGQALSAMTKRTYFLQSVQGPDSSGRVVMQGKDILARIEERKAQAPVASPGVLNIALDAVTTTVQVANAVTADYPSSGTIRINDEVMTYSGKSVQSYGLQLTGVTRGTDNTTAAAHDVDDAVQLCLRYTDADVDTVLEDLLTTYGGIDASFLDTTNWSAEYDEYLNSYRVNALITEPVSVSQLVSELQVQCVFYIWWDERDALVKFKSIRGISEAPDTINDEAHILEGSFSLREKPRERASQVWFYYDLIDPTQNPTEASSFARQFVVANLESETAELYGEPSIREIYSRWITTPALAQNTASKIITRYVDVPSEARFRLDAKDRAYWVGDTVLINHYLDVDAFGERRLRQWTIVSAEEVVPGEVVEYVAEDTTLYGKITVIQAPGSADYPGAETAPFLAAYIGDNDGLLSDGQPSARVA